MVRKIEKEGTAHWQSITPARYIIKSHELTVKSVFQETKAQVLSAYFGGMTFVETIQGSKKYRAEISTVPKGDIRSLCVDWVDEVSPLEVYHHRLYVPRAEVSETDEAQWTRTRENRWGITFSALAPAGSSTVLAIWLTDDPAVVAGLGGASGLAESDEQTEPPDVQIPQPRRSPEETRDRPATSRSN
jgi:hypothetical protein